MWGTIAGRIVGSLGKVCAATRDIFGKTAVSLDTRSGLRLTIC